MTARSEYLRNNRDVLRERLYAWRKANPEKVREQRRRWAKAHPIRRAADEAKRRAKVAGVHVEAVDYDAIINRDHMLCHLCGEVITQETLSFDHAVPLKRGGAHTFENIKLAHRFCNLSKKNLLPEEWRAKQIERGRVMVSSWPRGGQQIVVNWVEP